MIKLPEPVAYSYKLSTAVETGIYARFDRLRLELTPPAVHPDAFRELTKLTTIEMATIEMATIEMATIELAAAQGQEPVNAMLVVALEEARNGLAWYQAMYPGATDGSDDEAMERIDAALTAAKDGASDV